MAQKVNVALEDDLDLAYRAPVLNLAGVGSRDDAES
jgi:hypothetical protein